MYGLYCAFLTSNNTLHILKPRLLSQLFGHFLLMVSVFYLLSIFDYVSASYDFKLKLRLIFFISSRVINDTWKCLEFRANIANLPYELIEFSIWFTSFRFTKCVIPALINIPLCKIRSSKTEIPFTFTLIFILIWLNKKNGLALFL